MTDNTLDRFITAAGKVGATIVSDAGVDELAAYIAGHLNGPLLLPQSPSLQRSGLHERLTAAGVAVIEECDRDRAAAAAGGLTGANFGIADTGTVVLDSTAEATRLASTLPEQHFVLLDPAKIVADGLAAVAPLRDLHRRDPRNYVAYITGPSRTADIERVLTIGVHGPKRLHILLAPGLSSDLLEN